MARHLPSLRNIGVIAHIDAGKTTVTERMLFCSGVTYRVGEVDKGTTETDFDEEEQQRGITIYSACVSFAWRDVHVNLIDTPGHVDFTAEVERSLRVLDGVVVVFSAREGVEAQSETVWRQANKYGVPRVTFINKMDREGADFEGTLQQMERRLDAKPVVIQIPVGEGPPHLKDAFRGIIDLISMKMLVFPQEGEGKVVQASDLPAEEVERAELWRETMLERLYDFSGELMEYSLQGKEVPESLIRQVLRGATIQGLVQPVLCGSALDGIGIPPLLDAVAYFLPSPADRPAVVGHAPSPAKKKDAEPVVASRAPVSTAPFCGLVFKVLPAKTGDLCWVRVYAGELKPNTRAYNPGKDKKENVAQLWRMHASRREQVPLATAGDIVGVIGLRNSVTGDTLCDPHDPILLETIQFPETVLSMAIEPESTDERKKLTEVLDLMRRQDPTFVAMDNAETGQTLISGMGELHLEVIKNRLLRDFKLQVKVHKPRVSYRESIAHAAEVDGECHRQVGGVQLFGKVRVRMEPTPAAQSKVLVANACPAESLPRELVDAALNELQALGEAGGAIGGFPLMRLKVTLLGGEVADVGSTDVAFRIAAADAFNRALRAAGPILMEPVMHVEITTPEAYLGEFVSDVQQRRGTIARTEPRGDRVVIEAEIPLAELFGYSSSMRSISQGRAGCAIEPLTYAVAPAHVSEEFGF